MEFLTPSEVAKLLRVSYEKVLNWIRSGKLTAANLSDGLRPRYRIERGDVEAFLRSRQVQPPQATTRRRRQPPDGGPLDPAIGRSLAKKGEAQLVGGNYYRVCDGMILFF